MHKPLSQEEIAAINAAVPVTEMTVAQKRARWAEVLEKASHVVMTNGLEYLDAARRNAAAWTGSPMALVAADPVLKEAGLKGETVGDAISAAVGEGWAVGISVGAAVVGAGA